MPGWRWGSKGKGAAGRSWAFQMVWLLVTAVTTRLGAFCDSSHDLEASEEVLGSR